MSRFTVLENLQAEH
jgi:hypothetical protein